MFQKIAAYEDIPYAVEDIFLCCHPVLMFPFGSVLQNFPLMSYIRLTFCCKILLFVGWCFALSSTVVCCGLYIYPVGCISSNCLVWVFLMNISLRLSSPLCCHLADIYLQLHDSSALVWNLLSLNYFVLMIKWYFFCQHLFLYPISFYQSYVNSYLFTISVILKAKSSFLHKILSISEVLELFFPYEHVLKCSSSFADQMFFIL